jgi:hypothetical protein
VSAAGGDDPAALKSFTHDADLKDSLYLVKNGIPFDVAFSLNAFDRRVWVIAFGELDGMVWDYASGGWL